MGAMTETLKRAIRESEASLYRIAKDAGVDYTVLHNFARDRNDIMLVNADKLAAYFRLELTSADDPAPAVKKTAPRKRTTR